MSKVAVVFWSGTGNTEACAQYVAGCIARLSERVRKAPSFPHEVGLFLGYPAEDVDGFVRNRARGFKCSGLWKVYGDAAAAQKRFDEFEACTRRCVKQYRNGATLRELTRVW